MPSAVPTKRRTQAERSEATRAALLDATVACLVEEGYANTTTSRVAERAGVSRGAHLHHFQTRAALLAAAFKHLSRRRTDELIAAARELPEGRARIPAGLDILWSSYASPLFQGAMELWTHARTDPELHSHLVEVERVVDRQTLELAASIFPDLARGPSFEPLIEMAVATARGLALLDTLNPGEGRNAAQWPFCRERLVEMLAELAASDGPPAAHP